MQKILLFMSMGVLLFANDMQNLKTAEDVEIFTNVNTKENIIEMPKNFVKVVLKAPLSCEDVGFSHDTLTFEDRNSFNEYSKEYIDGKNQRYCKEIDFSKSDVPGKDNIAYYSK